MGEQHSHPSASHFGLFAQTPFGRRAVGLLGIGAVFFVATILLANVGGQAGTGWPALTLAPAGLAAVASAISAVVAVIRDDERGGITLITLIVGLAIACVVFAEFIYPRE
jgi:hypothetical protein